MMSRDALCRARARPAWLANAGDRMRRLLGASVCLCLLLLSGCASGGTPEPDRLAPVPGGPGTVLWRRAIEGAPLNAEAWRVLYRSTGPGRAGHRSIRAGDHPPRRGAARRPADRRLGASHDRCGGSLRAVRGDVSLPDDPRSARHGGAWLYRRRDRLSWVWEPRNRTLIWLVSARRGPCLTRVRAARAVAGSRASARFAVWGHSQGGQAALFTGMIAARYRTRPAAHRRRRRRAGHRPCHAAAGGSRHAGGQEPDRDDTLVLEPGLWRADQTVRGAGCASGHRPAGRRMHRVRSPTSLSGAAPNARSRSGFLTVGDLVATQPWAGLVARNTPGTLPPDIPVFIAQGTGDAIVPARITRNYMRRLCAAGSRVAMVEMQGVGHGFAAMRSARDAVAWMADRFDGYQAPNDCP